MKSLFSIIVVILGLVSVGCSQGAMQYQGKLECKGKVALTGNGSLSIGAGYGGGGTNAWTLQGDCGNGFSIERYRERAEPPVTEPPTGPPAKP